MAIRYDKKLNQEINRTIKNFNQKIAKLEREERELLPSKVKKQQLLNYTNRQDLVKKLKELQRFSTRGAEDIITTKGGAKITKYELENLKQDLKVQKAKLTKQLNKLKTEQPKVFGKKQGFSYAEMGSQDYLTKKAKRKVLDKDIENLNQKELERLQETIEKLKAPTNVQDKTFKENYVAMLFTLAYYINYDKSKLIEIADVFYQLETEKFIKLFNEDMAIRAILDYYPFVTGKYKGMNPDIIRDEVTELYDELYSHLEQIKIDYA